MRFPSGTWFRGGEGEAVACRVAFRCGWCVDDDQAQRVQVGDGVPNGALRYAAFGGESSLAWITDSGFIGPVCQSQQNQFGHGWNSLKLCCPVGGLVTHSSRTSGQHGVPRRIGHQVKMRSIFRQPERETPRRGLRGRRFFTWRPFACQAGRGLPRGFGRVPALAESSGHRCGRLRGPSAG